MLPKFHVTSEKSSSLVEIPGDWTTSDFQEILRLTDYGDTTGLSPKDVRDMALMSIADLPKNEAAELLMIYAFPEDALSPGQRQNSSHEMETEKLWEEYPEPAQHRSFFRVASLLYVAFNGGFPKPDARQITLKVTSGKEGSALLSDPTSAFVLRLLAAGMDGHALLHRLYEDELTGKRFDAAADIIWSVASRLNDDGSFTLEVLSSEYWLGAFHPGRAYECEAYADELAEEENPE